MSKTALITGATSGMANRNLSKNNYKIILCGRREDRMVELEKNFQTDRSTYLTFDVIRKPFQKASLLTTFSTIDILINNVTQHGLDPIQNGDLDDWDAMIDINVKLYVSKAIIPQMIERKSGHIINIGSTAAKKFIQTGMYS
jgi:NADP-dependent 3-hydroxy acid dehydrogenase YdfG